MTNLPTDIITFAENNGYIPVDGWHAEFNQKKKLSSPPKAPSLKTIAEFAPTFFRYMSNVYFPCKKEKTLPFMDHLNPVKMESMYGVPLGGIGCGTIGRGFKGEFCRSSLRPGLYSHRVNPVDHFIVTVKRTGDVYQQVLSPATSAPSNATGLYSWNWGFPADRGHYVGLYPRSWTVYELPDVNIVLICEQISPVIPHNYKDSCLPLGVFRWSVLNFDPEEEVTVSITLTWRGSRYKRRPPPSNAGLAGDHCCDPLVDGPTDIPDSLSSEYTHHSKQDITIPFDSKENHLRGCLMETRICDFMPCCFGIAARASDQVDVSRCMGFQYSSTTKENHQNEKSASRNGSSRQSDFYNEEIEAANITAGQSDSSCCSYLKAQSAADLWLNLKLTGTLVDDSKSFIRKAALKMSPKIGMAVCATCTVPPASREFGEGELKPGRRTLDFFLTWHIPRVYFRSAVVAYKRRYTRWFSEDMILGAGELLSYAANHVDGWRMAIEDWQAPVLKNPTLPKWYKSALFNELYFVSDGGTVWLDTISGTNDKTSSQSEIPPIDVVRSINPNVELDPLQLTGRSLLNNNSVSSTSSSLNPSVAPCLSTCENAKQPEENGSRSYSQDEEQRIKTFQARTELGKEMGLFAYLEGHEYRMFNTYDVHFNASWALIQLWPKIQLAMNYDLADMTLSKDNTLVTFMYKGQTRARSNTLAVPHDCGDPEDEPWININAYIMYPTDDWKDLNPKFILMAWRDWKFTSDNNYLLYMLPILVSVLQNSLARWDSDGDGIIENGGFPDQTYDMCKTTGLSAYVGGLWISALYAVNEMLIAARKFNPTPAGKASSWSETEDNLAGLLQRAKTAYHDSLWEGTFYRYDLHASQTKAPVLADQMSGYWFLRIGGAPSGTLLPTGVITRALKTIVELNWKGVKNGKMGAINSIYSNTKTDNSNMQAEEFWVAVNYGLGSLLIVEGMPKDGFSLAGACFKHIYDEMGLHFQTPEAFTKWSTYRSLGYMRPLAIWSIHRALEIVAMEKTADDEMGDQDQFQLLCSPSYKQQHNNHIPSK